MHGLFENYDNKTFYIPDYHLPVGVPFLQDATMQLAMLRRERNFFEAYVLIDELLNGEGEQLGMAKMQAALTRYCENPGLHLRDCLTLTDQAIAILIANPELKMKAALNGLKFAKQYGDCERTATYATVLKEFVTAPATGSEPWVGRCLTAMGLHWSDTQRFDKAEEYLLKSHDWHAANKGPFDEGDPEHRDWYCQVSLIYTGLCELYCRQERTAQAEAMLRRGERFIAKGNRRDTYHYCHGILKLAQKDYKSAVQSLEASLQLLRNEVQAGDPELALKVIKALVQAYREINEATKANTLLEPLIDDHARGGAYSLVLTLQRLRISEGRAIG